MYLSSATKINKGHYTADIPPPVNKGSPITETESRTSTQFPPSVPYCGRMPDIPGPPHNIALGFDDSPMCGADVVTPLHV
jgi:hypothetical protein